MTIWHPAERGGMGTNRALRSRRGFFLGAIAAAVLLVPTAASAPNTKFFSNSTATRSSSPATRANGFRAWPVSRGRPARSRRMRLPSTPSPICGPAGCTSSGRDRCRRDQHSRSGRRCSSGIAGQTARHTPALNSKLSGTPARLLTWSCTDGYNAIGITALHAHLGYFMIVASKTTSSRASNRTAFSGAQASFRFLPK